MKDRGWTDDRAELLRAQLLAWVADWQVAHPGSLASVRTVAEALSAEVAQVMAIRDLLAHEGLAEQGEGLVAASSSVFLTPQGLGLLAEWRAAQASPPQRRVACRDALLNWMDGQGRALSSTDVFEGAVQAHIFGAPFTQEEIRAATEHLFELGLIHGATTWGGPLLRPTITSTGRSVLERFDGQINDYLDRQDSHMSGVAITHSPGAQIMHSSPGAKQSSRVTLSADQGDRFKDIALQMSSALVDLPEPSQRDAAEAVSQLAKVGEQRSADPGQVRTLLGTIATAAAAALGTDGAQQLIQLVGEGMNALGS